MQKVSLKKLSILGVTLLAASAVVSAMVPGNNKKAKRVVNGVLQAQGVNTADTHTCVAVDEGGNCHNSASAGANGTSSGGGTASTTVTAGNTTTGDVN
jgi:uncharacterized protein YacL